MSAVKRILHVVDWSNRLIPYSKALQIQESQAELCKQRLIHDTIILLQVSTVLPVLDKQAGALSCSRPIERSL